MSKKIIKDNQLDHIVEIVQKKLEDITELPGGIEKVWFHKLGPLLTDSRD